MAKQKNKTKNADQVHAGVEANERMENFLKTVERFDSVTPSDQQLKDNPSVIIHKPIIKE